jgi:hypothetical protein
VKWISVLDKLPKNKEKVLILVDGHNIQTGIFYKGRKKEEIDPYQGICSYDQNGNNLVPYKWRADGGPMEWFGQDVTHWMYLPQIDKETKKDIENNWSNLGFKGIGEYILNNSKCL